MRLIDADALIIDYYDDYELKDDEYSYPYVSKFQIDSAPTIDIVRCKECKYDGNWKCKWRNVMARSFPSADDFCSYGERSDT